MMGASRGMVTRPGVSLLALLLTVAGCALEDDSIARVGDRAITAQDLQDFIDKLQHAGDADAREQPPIDHLQTIIDFELMLLEARSRGIDRSSVYLARMDRIRKAKLVSEFEGRSIDTTVQEGELEEFIVRKGFDRAIRLGDIAVADLETAEEAVREIEAGARFADVARKLSMNEETAGRGGDTGRYTTRGQLLPFLAEELFELAVGSLSDPVKVGGRYVVFKILDEREAQTNPRQLGQIAEKLVREKRLIAKAELVAELADQYSLEPVPDGIAAAVEALRTGAESVDRDPTAIVIFRYDGGEILAADLIIAAKRRKGNVLESLRDTEQVIAFAEQHIIPDRMIQEAAVREGIDREEATVQWLEEKAKQTLAEALRSSVLRERAKITEHDVRQYYEINADRFLHPEQTQVQEILVETEEKALRLVGLIKDGAALGDLAKRHSIRSAEVRDDEGRFHVHRHESPQFGGFVEAAVEAEIGALTGPVKVQEGYSIFKVLSRERKRETFDEAEARTRSELRRKTRRDVFNEFMEELRSRYASEVSIDEDRLQRTTTLAAAR